MATKQHNRKSVPHTVRFDDDVWAALKRLPESPNKFLRKVLSARGAFDKPSNTITRAKAAVKPGRKVKQGRQ